MPQNTDPLPTIDADGLTERRTEAPTLAPAPAAGAPTLPPGLEIHPEDEAPSGVARVPGYEVLAELGRGGMGVVYKAKQVSLNRTVALKMILSGGHASAADLARFRGEAEAIAQMRHPNIVQVYEVGEQHGLPYFSLEYCDGGGLDRRLVNPLAPRQAAELVRTLATAVHAAHQAGIIHRDLKPANVLFLHDGTPKITDFGLAKKTQGQSGLTQSGAVMGTPSYMAPEQASGQSSQVTTLADVYALGAILYECLTGRPPFRAESPIDTILQVVSRDPDPPSTVRPGIDRDLELICLKCLAKTPAQRYASAEALAADLGHWLDGTPVTVRPPTLITILRSWLRQSFGAAAWTIPIGVASGLLTSLVIWLLVINPGISEVAESYQAVTGARLSWLIFSGPLAEWLNAVISLAATAAVAGAGLIVARLVRPANRQADVAAGLVTGMIAAVTLFSVSFGWFAVLAKTVGERGIQRDLRWLAHAAWSEGELAAPAPITAHARQQLLEKYPRLADIPIDKRGRAMQDKIAGDLATGIPVALWFALLATAGLSVSVYVSGTVTAGALLRRDSRLTRVLPGYLEHLIPLAVFCSMLFILLLAMLLGIAPNLPLWYIGLCLAVTALAVIGVQFRWRWPLRLLLHATWIALLLCEGLMEYR